MQSDSSKATEELNHAHEMEEIGQYSKAVQHYTNAVQYYRVILTDPSNDEYTRCAIASQATIIISHINTLKERAEKNDSVSRGGHRILPTTTTTVYPSVNSTNDRPPTLVHNQQQQRHNDEENRMKNELMALRLTPEQMTETKWEDVIGMEKIKKFLLTTTIVPREMPDLFVGNQNRKAPTSLLMYGPPGVGKTFILKALANKCGHTFLPVTCASLISKYVGDSPKYVKAMFEVAKASKPCVLFIDEIDSLCPSRGGASSQGGGSGNDSSKTIAELLQQWDGITDDMRDVLLIGCTNLPWVIDEAIRRRFNRKVYIALPSIEDRYKLISHRLALNKDDINHCITEKEIEKLAEETLYYSGSDIVTLIQTAYQNTVNEITEARYFKRATTSSGQTVIIPCREGDPIGIALTYDQIDLDKKKLIRSNAITYQGMIEAMQQVKPSVTLSTLDHYTEWTRLYGEESNS